MFTHIVNLYFSPTINAGERRQLARRRAPLNRSKWSGAARRMDFLVSAEPWLRNYTMHCTLARLCWRLRGKERDAEPDRVLIQSTTPDAADTHTPRTERYIRNLRMSHTRCIGNATPCTADVISKCIRKVRTVEISLISLCEKLNESWHKNTCMQCWRFEWIKKAQIGLETSMTANRISIIFCYLFSNLFFRAELSSCFEYFLKNRLAILRARLVHFAEKLMQMEFDQTKINLEINY